MAALDMVRELASAGTVGVFVDRTMAAMGDTFPCDFVSFNRVDLAHRRATVAFRPYRREFDETISGLGRLLDEHPLFQWYMTQPDWSPKRISDVMPWSRFRTTRLFVEVLGPINARHTIVIMLTPPTLAAEMVCLVLTRTDEDFTDDELAACVRLQPGLVALYTHLTTAGHAGTGASVNLTRREQTVLEHLADGLTAAAIARRLAASPATVRKHLQNIYAKLGMSDRLGAVIRARDLGLLHNDDVSREFDWNIRHDMAAPVGHTRGQSAISTKLAVPSSCSTV